jgi:hypothetical protein
MSLNSVFRGVTASGLSGLARILAISSRTADQVAGALRPSGPAASTTPLNFAGPRTEGPRQQVPGELADEMDGLGDIGQSRAEPQPEAAVINSDGGLKGIETTLGREPRQNGESPHPPPIEAERRSPGDDIGPEQPDTAVTQPGGADGARTASPTGATDRARERVGQLAEANAKEVIASLESLSVDELRALYEHESCHKKRKTVLEAITSTTEGARKG